MKKSPRSFPKLEERFVVRSWFAPTQLTSGRSQRTRSSVGRLAWMQVAALLAFVLQLACPRGYMFESDPTTGWPSLVICPGPTLAEGDHVEHALEHAGANEDEGGAPQFQQSHCPAAGVSKLALPLTFGQPVKFAGDASPAFSVAENIRPGRGIAAPPPPSTGPPSLI